MVAVLLNTTIMSTRIFDEYRDGRVVRSYWEDQTECLAQRRKQTGRILSKLLRDRRLLLETASGKISTLTILLNKEDTGSLRHTLVYTSDKGPSQLDNVNRLLNDRSILFRQLTAEETANRDLTKRIIKSFQDGEIQVLTAKRVLDEGVNIPQICKAFILQVRLLSDNGCNGGAGYYAHAASSERHIA